MFRNLKLGHKLAGSIMLVTLLLVLVGGLTVVRLMDLSNRVTTAMYEHVPNRVRALELQIAVERLVSTARGFVLSGDARLSNRIDELKQDVATAIARMEEIASGEDDQVFSAEVRRHYATLSAAIDEAVEQYRLGFRDRAVLAMMTEGESARIDLEDLINPRVEEKRQLFQEDREILLRSIADSRNILGAALVVALVLAVVVVLVLPRTIARPVLAVHAGMIRLAEGDLTVEEIEVASGDEVGQMAEAFNRMIRELRVIIGRIFDAAAEMTTGSKNLARAAEQAAAAANQIAAAIQQVAAGANDQSQSAEDSVRSVEQLRSAIGQIASGAQQQSNHVEHTAQILRAAAAAVEEAGQEAEEVSMAAGHALSSAQTGGEAVRTMLDSMQRINNATAEVAESIRQLGGYSQQIGEIVQLIDGIAEQTNLLALNAAIEAARAGEHGRGFAVVADEVRNLAERSQAATRDIEELINTIRRLVESAVAAMEAGLAEVEAGTALAGEAGDALNNILTAMEQTHSKVQGIRQISDRVRDESHRAVEAMDRVAGITEEYMAATEEMAVVSDQVHQAIHQVAAVAQQTAASSEEVSASSEEVNAAMEDISTAARNLNRMAEELNELVAHFRISVEFPGQDHMPDVETGDEEPTISEVPVS